jgi:hypothetical protein
MRLEYVGRVQLAYRGGFTLLKLYGEEGAGYGEVEGTVSGPGLRGTLRGVNHPHARADGTMLPETHGLIATEDGATILFHFQGRTAFGQDQVGRQCLAVTFEAADARYRWLNTALCVLEGIYDPAIAGDVCLHQ